MLDKVISKTSKLSKLANACKTKKYGIDYDDVIAITISVVVPYTEIHVSEICFKKVSEGKTVSINDFGEEYVKKSYIQDSVCVFCLSEKGE